MSDQFFDELDLPCPDIELGVGSSSHAEQTGKMLTGIEAAILTHKPDMVLLYGDTNSTLAGALAAAKTAVPIAHVEAGLRSFNRTMPEEINRVVTDTVSSLLFCPSETAVANLRREGITRGVHLVGDVMWEVLNRMSGDSDNQVLSRLGLKPGSYVIATVHRAENTDSASRFHAIMRALERMPLPVIFPVHPRLRTLVGDRPFAPHIHVVEPLGYRDVVSVVRDAHAVMTDSGGLQKEAYWLGVPCITLRDETEWTETVASGWNVLTGADEERIAIAVQHVTRPSRREPLYGEGAVAGRIIDLIASMPVEARG